MRAVVLAVDVKLSHDDCVVCGSTEGSDPPLGSRQRRGVHGECLSVRVPCRPSLETSDVGAMAELGLGVGTDVDVRFSFVEEESLLFLGGLISQSGL